MYSTLEIFSCDLNEPILIPAAEDFEPANESFNRSAFGTGCVRSRSQEADEWSDIT